MGAPDIILSAHRDYFEKVVFVSIEDESWDGASVTSYLHSMSPPSGDVISFDLIGASDPLTTDSIAHDLAEALRMERLTSETEDDD